MFNLGRVAAPAVVKTDELKFPKKANVRDLWRQKDLGAIESQLQISVAAPGAELLQIAAARQ